MENVKIGWNFGPRAELQLRGKKLFINQTVVEMVEKRRQLVFTRKKGEKKKGFIEKSLLLARAIPFAALLLLACISVRAQDFTYSTNLYAGISSPTNIFAGTNSTDPSRDSYITIWNKLNNDLMLMWSAHQTDAAGIAVGRTNAVFTNILAVPYIWLGSNTVSHSTNSTFGYRSGLITVDTNFLYISVGSNTWSRVALPTNGW